MIAVRTVEADWRKSKKKKRLNRRMWTFLAASQDTVKYFDQLLAKPEREDPTFSKTNYYNEQLNV